MEVTKESNRQMSENEPALVGLCSKAVNLTVSISTHLSDYVESPEAQNDAVRSFATKFRRLREILQEIQAGISDISNAKVFVPYKASQELSTKIQHTIEDLVSSDLIVVKLVTSARKKGFKKFMDGFKRASLDAEMLTLRDALARHCEKLSTGWTSFREVLKRIDQNPFYDTSLPNDPKHHRDTSKTLSDNTATRPLPPEKENVTPNPLTYHPSQSGMSTAMASSTPTADAQWTNTDPASTRPAMSTKSSYPFDEPRTPPSEELDWVKAKFWSADRPWQIDSFSRSSSFRFNPGTSMSEIVIPSSAESQLVRVNTNSIMEKPHLATIPQEGNHKALHHFLKGVSKGDSIHPSLLSQAVKDKDVASVGLLLSHGVPVNHIDNDGNSPLILAVATSSIDIARLLLEHGANPNLGSGRSGMSPFTLAAQRNQTELVQVMLDCGANVNEVSSKGDTPINMCISHGAQAEMIKLLLTAGANANGKSRDGKTPLFEALTIRRVDIVSLLLDHGANPNLAGPKHPLWPATYLPAALKLLIDRGAKTKMAPGNMELAASINSIQSIQILLDAGVSPNLKKDGVYTPLCSAIRDDRADIVELLLSHGADPNLQASEYPAWKCITHNRLHFLPSVVAAGADLHSPPGIAEVAVASNNKEALMYLLLNRVNINACNEEGRTALTTAVRDDRIQLIDVLLAHGANVTLRGEDWPLCMALKKPAILKRLLEHVHNPNSISKGIIELAVQANQLESIKLLVGAGISVEDRTGGVFSPLTSAIRENRKEIVHYLLEEAGADVNAPGEHLPLIKAIRRNTDSKDTEIIEVLLEHGADINLMYRGWNAIMQAIEKGDKRLIHVLIEKGNGIDLQTVDPESGQTVYEIIHDRGWSEGVDLIMEHRHQLRMVTDGSGLRN